MSSHETETAGRQHADGTRYQLHYLTRDERELAGLKPCHLCSFQGRCSFEPSCRALGRDAYFVRHVEDHEPTAEPRRVRAAIRAAKGKWNEKLNPCNP